MNADVYWVGASVRARIRAMEVDPVTEAESPLSSLSSVTIRFRNPDNTILSERTLSDGVVNAGDGYYHATATPEMEGLHIMEGETEGGLPGRVKVPFSVEPF